MEGAAALAALAAAAGLAILMKSYRSLGAPFFLYLLIAGLSLACAATASCLIAVPPAEALFDLGLAAFGAALAAASRQLLASFRLAGGDYD